MFDVVCAIAAAAPCSHPEVLMAALSAALQRLIAAAAPDMARAALGVRQMAGAAAGDAQRLAVFR